jgi:hypothetical protein
VHDLALARDQRDGAGDLVRLDVLLDEGLHPTTSRPFPPWPAAGQASGR